VLYRVHKSPPEVLMVSSFSLSPPSSFYTFLLSPYLLDALPIIIQFSSMSYYFVALQSKYEYSLLRPLIKRLMQG
jgi:hypothetical protein